MSTDNTATELKQLASELAASSITSGLKASATQMVFGEGNPEAEIVMVGEAPGKEEDRLGRPFVGAAGKFLDKLLAQINLDRTEVYITNVVKYRPPENRDPEPHEVAAFRPYLLRQIAIIKPRLVATLGRFAMGVFLPGLRISQVHGQPKRIRVRKNAANNSRPAPASMVVLPLYHPAAALYNGGMRTILEADFQKIPQILELIKKETNQNEQASA